MRTYNRNIDRETFKSICLDMLQSFISVCDKYELRYFVDYGTLLGAIRHKGFIPWDDDVDISMPREDYEKLYSIFEKNDNLFGKTFKLARINNKYNVYKPYLNIVDVSTVTISNVRKEKYYYPIWIDIFPVDGLKDSSKVFKDKKRIAKLINGGRRFLMNEQNVFKKIYHFIFNNKMFSIKKFTKADLIAKNNPATERMLCYYSIYGDNDYVLKSYFDNYITRSFEGVNVRVPAEYDKRLNCLYGNYMKLPPKEKRAPHSIDAFYVI